MMHSRGGGFLFSFTDSPLANALKVISKVAIETGFPCIPTVKESEGGRGGGLFERCACFTLWPKGQVLIQGIVGAYLRNTVNLNLFKLYSGLQPESFVGWVAFSSE